MEIRNETHDEERALYHLQNALVTDCAFAGPADGESALKECRDITVKNCRFSLRYPLWHTVGFRLENCRMADTARAAIWYSGGGAIIGCELNGIKALRECEGIALSGVSARSPEFGWRCRGLSLEDCRIESEYFLFECRDVAIDRLNLTGKYSFQYIENMSVKNSNLDTKDAFWHTKNVTVEDCVLKGEYLGWYSENLTLARCKIIGTQPLCYCKNLRLIDCTMEKTDLSFEYSDVFATVNGEILSVKNPKSGSIVADSFGEIIFEDSVMETNCSVEKRASL